MEQISFAQDHLVGVGAFHVSRRIDLRSSRADASTVSNHWSVVGGQGCLPSIFDLRCLYIASMA